MPVIFLVGGSITMVSTYNLTVSNVVDAPDFTQLFFQSGSGTLRVTSAVPPLTLEKFGGGTSVANNAPAFSAAFGAVNSAGGGILYLGPGTYQVGGAGATPILLFSNTTVQGAGRDATVILVNPTTPLGTNIFNANGPGLQDIAFTDLTVDGGSTTGTGPRLFPPWLSAPASSSGWNASTNGAPICLSFYDDNTTINQASFPSSGVIIGSTGGVVNELSMTFWEQGVVVTPNPNTTSAFYDFVFTP